MAATARADREHARSVLAGRFDIIRHPPAKWRVINDAALAVIWQGPRATAPANAGRQALMAATMACSAPGLTIFAFMETHLSGGFGWNSSQPDGSCQHWIRRRPQFGDQPLDVGEELSRDYDLGHLEGDIAAVNTNSGW